MSLTVYYCMTDNKLSTIISRAKSDLSGSFDDVTIRRLINQIEEADSPAVKEQTVNFEGRDYTVRFVLLSKDGILRIGDGMLMPEA